MTRIIIAGGAGYLGSALTARLLVRDDNEVYVVDKLNYGNSGVSPFLELDNYHFTFLDVTTPEFVALFNRIKPDAVVNLAALVGPVADLHKLDALASNLKTTEILVSMANKAKIPFTFVSTCSNYGRTDGLATETTALNPISYYSETKVQAENFVTKYSNKYVLFRFGTLYGIAPRLRLDIILNEWVKNAISGKNLEIFEPQAYRPLLDVYEAARIIGMAIEGQIPDGVYNVHDGNHTKISIANAVKDAIAGLKVTEVQKGDRRSYQVSCDKIEALGVKIEKADLVNSAVRLANVIRTLDYNNPRYDNVSGYRRDVV